MRSIGVEGRLNLTGVMRSLRRRFRKSSGWLVFVAFAVDVLFLIPVALVYNRIPEFVYRDFVEMFIFVGILSLVIVYAWKKGVFEWKRKMTVPKP